VIEQAAGGDHHSDGLGVGVVNGTKDHAGRHARHGAKPIDAPEDGFLEDRRIGAGKTIGHVGGRIDGHIFRRGIDGIVEIAHLLARIGIDRKAAGVGLDFWLGFRRQTSQIRRPFRGVAQRGLPMAGRVGPKQARPIIKLHQKRTQVFMFMAIPRMEEATMRLVVCQNTLGWP